MFEKGTIIILAVFSFLFLLSPFVVNIFYQRKAKQFADDILAENVAEYNKQIRGNAVILLVRRSLWALFVLSGVILNFRALLDEGFKWLIIGVCLLGIACFAFGIQGYRAEIKRLKTLS